MKNSILSATGWVSDAEVYESPNFNERPQGIGANLLVIHSISLPPDEFPGEDVIAFFQNRLDVSKDPYYETIKHMKVSAHFFIERSGKLVQFVSVYDRAWHAGISSFDEVENCNDYSIGIEMEGCDTMPFTDAQYQRLTALTKLLQQHFPEMTKERIVSHAAIALPKGRKTDPGPYFKWDEYLQGL